MVRAKTQALICIFFGLAVISYFTSESILRQVTIYRINANNLTVKDIISRLPSWLKSATGVEGKIRMTQMENDLKVAKNDDERVQILNEMAMFKDGRDRLDMYKKIIADYPAVQGSGTAYQALLVCKEEDYTISFKEYHDFIGRIPKTEQVWAWEAGMVALDKEEFPLEKQLEFLMPLMDIKPPYFEYVKLYTRISSLSIRLNKGDIAVRAGKMESECMDLPSAIKPNR